MEQGQASTTARNAGVSRALHQFVDDEPKVLADPVAVRLVEAAAPGALAAAMETCRLPERKHTRALMVYRSRFAEDELAGAARQGIRQYVVLGAGLDTFAYRQPPYAGALQIFEVDHPATQAWKRQRAEGVGLPGHDAHVYVPVDFEVQHLDDALADAGFDRAQPALFSCVGVAMYLKGDAVASTLRTVATCAAGSEIVLGYNLADECLDDIGREFLAAVSKRVAASDEPLRSAMSPQEAEALVADCGLVVVDHPTADDLAERYGVRPYTLERLLTARVP